MPLTLSASELALDAALPNGTYQVMLLADLSEAIGVDNTSVTAGSANIEVLANTLQVNSAVFFSTSGTLYDPLASNTLYRVVTKGPGDAIQISRTAGGAPIVLNDTGFGAHSVESTQPVELVGTETAIAFDLDDLLRFEIANYPGSTRPEVTLSTTETRPDQKYKPVQLLIDNSVGTSVVEFGYVAFLLNGSTSPGDSTGDCRAVVAASPAVVQVPIGEQRIATINLNLGPC